MTKCGKSLWRVQVTALCSDNLSLLFVTFYWAGRWLGGQRPCLTSVRSWGWISLGVATCICSSSREMQGGDRTMCGNSGPTSLVVESEEQQEKSKRWGLTSEVSLWPERNQINNILFVCLFMLQLVGNLFKGRENSFLWPVFPVFTIIHVLKIFLLYFWDRVSCM